MSLKKTLVACLAIIFVWVIFVTLIPKQPIAITGIAVGLFSIGLSLTGKPFSGGAFAVVAVIFFFWFYIELQQGNISQTDPNLVITLNNTFLTVSYFAISLPVFIIAVIVLKRTSTQNVPNEKRS